MPVSLTEATVQEIQLELIRRTEINALDGEQVAESLLAHRDLWEAALLDRFSVRGTDLLGGISLIKLRDLSTNFWNADTLYVLCPDAASAHKLAHIIETEDWGGDVCVHDDRDEVDRALGGSREPNAIVTVWWD